MMPVGEIAGGMFARHGAFVSNRKHRLEDGRVDRIAGRFALGSAGGGAARRVWGIGDGRFPLSVAYEAASGVRGVWDLHLVRAARVGRARVERSRFAAWLCEAERGLPDDGVRADATSGCG